MPSTRSQDPPQDLGEASRLAPGVAEINASVDTQKDQGTQKLARSNYTGPFVSLSTRATQDRADRSRKRKDPETHAEAHDYLTLGRYSWHPRTCKKCGKCFQKTPRIRKGSGDSSRYQGQLYWVCRNKRCRARVNTCRSGIFQHLRLKGLGPMSMFRVVKYYTRHDPSKAPSVLECSASTGVRRSVVHKMFKGTRCAEAALAPHNR